VPDFIPKGDGVDGAALFASNCAGCHGADGSGGVGPNLRGRSASFLSNAPSGVGAHSVINTFTDPELTAIAAFLSQ